ncbi:MAG: c-type cytochrome, partial [Bacteroidia bacterium]
MKSTLNIFLASFFAIMITLVAFKPTTFPNKPWDAPEKYQKMKNPVKADAGSIAEGKSLYTTHCQSCHGKKGKGDGPKAAQLETECGDFTKPDFQKQPDGAVFYKVSEGRKDMPSFKKKIPDEKDVWNLVNYVRT